VPTFRKLNLSFANDCISVSLNLNLTQPLDLFFFPSSLYIYVISFRGGLVALVAHNKMKAQMASFVGQNLEFFKHCRIITTGSTGKILEDSLGLCVYQKVSSGPLGGDQEIGALVTRGKPTLSLFIALSYARCSQQQHQHIDIDITSNSSSSTLTLGHVSAIFFFKDPLSAHQHAADIEALTRICDVHNVAYATNSASGKSLVTAMAFLGLGFGSSEESVTVKEYKAEQAQVIRRLSVIR